jgi:cell division protein ZapA
MAKISLKVNIAGRSYPLTINEIEKEAVLSAVENINNAIESLKKNYAVKDPQDLIAMTALQLIIKNDANQKSSDNTVQDLGPIDQALKSLSEQLDAVKNNP